MNARRTWPLPALLVAAVVVAVATDCWAAPQNELTVAAGVDSAYDGNVFNGRGPDFVNRISPHVAWRLLDPRVNVAATYDLGYWTYALGKAENSLNHRGSFTLSGRVTRRLTLNVSTEVVRAEDPGFLTRIGVVAPQIGILDTISEAGAGYAISRLVYGSVSYTYHHTSFDQFSAQQIMQGLPPLFDGDEHTPQTALNVRVAHNDDFRTGFRAQVFTDGHQHDSNPARFLVGAAYSPTVGWRHQFLRSLELGGDVGPLFYQALVDSPQIPGAPGSGVTWRLGARLRFYTPTWRASLSYTRDLVGATGVGTAIWADYVYAQAGYHYAERVDVSFGGGFFRNGRAVEQPTAYDGFTVDALVDVRVVDYFRVGAYYTLRWQETGPGAVPPGMPVAQFPDVTRNIVGIRLLAVLGAEARPPRREVHE